MTKLENDQVDLYITEAVKQLSILYFYPGFYNNPDHEVNRKNLESLVGQRIYVVRDWEELIRYINENVSLIVIHNSIIKENIGSGLPTFMKMLDNMIRYTVTSSQIPAIAMAVDNKCSQEFVISVAKTSIQGIIPVASSYGTLECAKSLEILMTGGTYWPIHIINALPHCGIKKPLHVLFGTNAKTCLLPEIVSEIQEYVNCDLKYCSTWEELAVVVSEYPTSIIFHDTMISGAKVSPVDFIKMLNILLKCNDSTNTIIGVSFRPETEYELIQELMDNNVECFIPGYKTFGKELCFKSLQILDRTAKCIPTDIIDKLPKSSKKSNTKSKIHLTKRQEEVLRLVCKRGLSNKKIASTLNISESTVKIHISAILKEYGVRNRTQLALAASSALKA